MNRYALVLTVFPLIACGSEDLSRGEVFETKTVTPRIAQSNKALEKRTDALSDMRRQDAIASYEDIGAAGLDEANRVAGLADDTAVAVVDVTGAIANARVREVRELWIPAGTVTQPKDPNTAKTFYVILHTDSGTDIYGPFPLLGREGSSCGHFIGGSLPDCASDLVCQSSGNPDESGVCQKS